MEAEQQLCVSSWHRLEMSSWRPACDKNAPVPGRPVIDVSLLSSLRLYGLLDLLLDGFQVEARTLLHRRKLDRRLG